jgi:hypothetical protein
MPRVTVRSWVNRPSTVRSLIAAAAVLTLLAAGCGSAEGATIHATPSTESPTPTVPAPEVLATEARAPSYRLVPPADRASLAIPDTNYYGWALLDRATGTISGSPEAETAGNTVESMIKPGIVADFLRRMTESGQTPSPQVLDELTLVIVDSNDPLAESYYQQGGAAAVVRRLIDICGLTGARFGDSWWSTWMTPVDAVRFGECVADGRAAGPQWTDWLLQVMTQVRGGVDEQISGTRQGGRWGIIDGLPPELAAQVSIKNGYTSYMDGWHVNCLAIHHDFVLAVMMRSWSNLRGAAEGCARVTRGLVVEKRPGD